MSATPKQIFTTTLPHLSDTEKVAEVLASVTPTCAWYYFSGNLGAGKSTFVRAFLRNFGVQGAIRSPTFTLVESYEAADYLFYHLDCYRLTSADELIELGLREYMGSDAVCLIEWPEKGQGILPVADCHFFLEIAGNSRRLTIESGTERGELILSKFISVMNTGK